MSQRTTAQPGLYFGATSSASPRQLASPSRVNAVSAIPRPLSPSTPLALPVTLDLSLHLAHPRCPQALNDGEDPRFSFEAARVGGESPYWQQGNTDLESPEALAMRAALRQDARVQRELGRFWSVHSKLADGTISKDEYLKARVKIALALIPDMTPEEARAAGEEDWVADAKGAARMSAEQLHDYLFEIADLWCSAIDGHEYAAFVRKLFRRVAVKVVHGSDGQMSVTAPAQPSKERKEEFETFRDARRRRLGLPPLGAASMPSGATSPAGGDEEEEAEAVGIGETVSFGWAPESDIYPFILYEEAPIDWTEYGDVSAGAKGAPPVPTLPVRTVAMVPRSPMVQRELQSSYSAKLLLPKQPLAEEMDAGGSAAAPSAARAHTARPQVSFAELEVPEPPAASKLPVRPASAQVSSRGGAQVSSRGGALLAADGSADDGEAGAAEAPAALRAPAVALPVPLPIQLGMPYENALALAQLSASSRALVTRHAVVRGLPKDLKADLMIPAGKGGYLKGAIALSHGGVTPNKKAPPPPSPLALPARSSSGRSMMPPPTEPDLHPGLLAVATACAATLASAKGAGRDAPDTALSATAAKDAVSAIEPPREGFMQLPSLAPEPCGELALLLGSARTNPKPRHVLVAGPPLLSEPLATALASALGAVLVSPTAAVMAASKGDDPLANALRNALSAGLTIGRAEQKEALLQLLASPEAQARGTVLIGMTCDAVTAAGTPPTATLAVVMGADELTAWKEEAEAAAAAAAAPKPLAEGEEAEEAPPPPPEDPEAPPPPPPPPPMSLAPNPLPQDDSDKAAQLADAALLHGQLPAPELLDAALVALGLAPRVRRALAVALPAEAVEQTRAEQLEVLKTAGGALFEAACPRYVAPGTAPEDAPPPPPLALSAWGTCCPVSLALGALDTALGLGGPLEGSTSCAAAFDGRLYLCATPEQLNIFLGSPSTFLAAPPQLRSTARLAVLGPPLSGASAVAGALAGSRRVERISMASLPSQLLGRADAEGAELAHALSAASGAGGKAPPPLVAESIARLLAPSWAPVTAPAEAAPSSSSSSSMPGVVFEGLPMEVGELEALQAVGLAPERVLIIGHDDGALKAKLAALLEKGQAAYSVTGEMLDEAKLDAALAAYAAALPPLMDKFAAAGIAVVTLPPDSTCEAAAAALDPFAPLAATVEVGDTAELPPFGPGSLGATGPYCPVALATDGRLVRGKAELGVSVAGRVYLCSTEGTRARLLAAPAALLPHLDGLSAPLAPPPPLLLLVGPPGCGKEEQARRLSDARKLPTLDLSALLVSYPPPPPELPPPPADGEDGTPPAESDVEAYAERVAELVAAAKVHTPTQIAECVARALKTAPFAGVGCVLEWSYDVALDGTMWEALLAAKLTPDGVVVFELSDDEADARLFRPLTKPTLKEAEAKIRRERAVLALREQADAEDEGEDGTAGPLKALFALDDQALIEARAAEWLGTALGTVGPVSREEASETLEGMLEATNAADETQHEELRAKNASATATLEALVEALEASAVPACKLSAEQRPGQLHRAVLGALEPLIGKRAELFSRAAPIEPAEAAAMIEAGEALPSRFGQHDVVMYVSKGLLSPPLVPTRACLNPPPPPSAEELAAAHAALVEAAAAEHAAAVEGLALVHAALVETAAAEHAAAVEAAAAAHAAAVEAAAAEHAAAVEAAAAAGEEEPPPFTPAPCAEPAPFTPAPFAPPPFFPPQPPPKGPEHEGVYCARLRESIYVFLTRSARDTFVQTPMRCALMTS